MPAAPPAHRSVRQRPRAARAVPHLVFGGLERAAERVTDVCQIHFGEFFDASLLLPSWTGQPPWRHTSAEEQAQLSEIPAQCVEWILGLGEEEFGEPLAARSGVSRQKIREKRPRLAAAWRRLLRRGTT